MNTINYLNFRVIRLLFFSIILICLNSRISPAQIVSGYEYIKIIKLINNERIDIVSQIAIGNKYVLTKDIKAYELDNISYKYEKLFECETCEKSGKINPCISFMRRDYSYYEDIYMAFYFESSCEIIRIQYQILKDFMNTDFKSNLINQYPDGNCNNLAQNEQIYFPKFEISNTETSCSLWQVTNPGATISSLSVTLHILKKKL